MTDRILFVDDDSHALEAYKRLLHSEFTIETALSGSEGLAKIQVLGPFAVVISDMLMPGMNGAEFLAKVREASPRTVRMLLTGYKDLDRAIEAVNEGQIFRYLAKPCGKSVLVSAIQLGLAQHKANVEDGQLIKEAKYRRLDAVKRGSYEAILSE